MARWRHGLLLVGTLLLLSGAVSGVEGARSAAALDAALATETAERAAGLERYFERARAVARVTAHLPAFADFYTASRKPAGSVSTRREVMRRVQVALRSLSQLYPGQLRSASLIDRGGARSVAVVDGRLVTGRARRVAGQAPLLEPTLALRPGQVHQSAPFVSPDTGERVISHSTPIASKERPAPGIVQYELTMESLRASTASRNPAFVVQILDLGTRNVVTDSRTAQGSGVARGSPPDPIPQALIDVGRRGEPFGTVNGRRYSVRPLPVVATNANAWTILVSAPAPSAAWNGPAAWGPVGLVVAGLLLLGGFVVASRRHARRLYEEARRDDLTGLANRSRLQEALRQLRTGSRDGAPRAAVLLLDVDRFKEVNDTLGHVAGDRLLQEVGLRLRSAMGEDGLAARLGGDEFAVLLRDGHAGNAVLLARAVIRALARPVHLDGVDLHVSASIGIALAPDHGRDETRLLRCADVAMYAAKGERGGIAVYDPALDRHSSQRLGLEAELLRAIDNHELVLHYQPRVALADRHVEGVEALVRWQHPQRGLLGPGEFVPRIEEIGLIRHLTRAVLVMALDQAKAWQAAGLSLRVAVNVSVQDLLDDDFPTEVAMLLAERDLPAGSLQLELTETASIVAPDRVGMAVSDLAQMGVFTALDDFGTGYSCLTTLKLLPVRALKIDRGFVGAMVSDRTDARIVASLVDLAHRLHLTVVAEGVEDADTERALAELGCDAAQGYHLGRPMPAEELTAQLEATRAAQATPR